MADHHSATVSPRKININITLEIFSLKMDFDRQQLAAAEREIKELGAQRKALRKLSRERNLTADEEEDLADIEQKIIDARTSADRWTSVIRAAMQDLTVEKQTFSVADRPWIRHITLVDTDARPWDDYVLDEKVVPSSEFKTWFTKFSRTFHQSKEPGRRVFLNLFLSDILDRSEFNNQLRIFPELDMEVALISEGKRKVLSGTTDYTIGFAGKMDILQDAIPDEIHLVAVEAKSGSAKSDIRQCIAEAAALHKKRRDAGKTNKRVWGIFSTAEIWKFIFIDDNGLLWQAGPFAMNLVLYNEDQVNLVYRFIHYVVKACYEACTPPVSQASSSDSSQ